METNEIQQTQTEQSRVPGECVPGECVPGECVPGELEEILSRWRERLRRTSRNLLGRRVSARADTSDVAQEGMVQVWKDLGKLRGSTDREVNAWIKRIGSGHAAKIRRHHMAVRRSAKVESQRRHDPPASQHNPLEMMERRETLAVLADAIEELEPRRQTVVVMRIFEDATFSQIAGRLDCSVSSARVLFAQAIEQLRVAMVLLGVSEAE
ncbi:MAG: sigma-70 family RNA polymerase sigma factor [Pirellulales bacterium]|nr:sigma-70 family RNA polymerase sigma factor [Pirellulales bacterium]